MKSSVKKLLIVVGACAIAATSYAMYTKVNATPGYHVLNASETSTFDTKHPAGCTGITFPTSLAADTTNPDSTNQIVVDQATAGTQICSTVYETRMYHTNRCLVTLSVNAGNVVSLSANPVNPYSQNGCNAFGGADVVLTGSGS